MDLVKYAKKLWIAYQHSCPALFPHAVGGDRRGAQRRRASSARYSLTLEEVNFIQALCRDDQLRHPIQFASPSRSFLSQSRSTSYSLSKDATSGQLAEN